MEQVQMSTGQTADLRQPQRLSATQRPGRWGRWLRRCVLGAAALFAAPAFAAVSISSFTPGSGPVGTAVTINGSGFSATPANNAVTVGGKSATVTSATTTKLVITVPATATTGPIKVTFSGSSATTPTNFTVTPPPPTISSFSPGSGAVGATVTITGTNFSTTPANNTVLFNTTTATVSAATATQLTATVPAGATTGKIKVTVAGNTATSTNNFTVTVPAPTITNFTPTSGPVGTVLTINGTNFSATPASNSVTVSNKAATVSAASTTQLTVTVPATATTGAVKVTVGGQTATASGNFTVLLPPTITSLYPDAAPVGGMVSIVGTRFSSTAANNLVKFNGLTAVVVEASTTQLDAVVPVGATTGPVTVTVNGMTATSAAPYPIAPSISAFTPARGPVGTTVTISGANFGATPAANSVFFNGTAATITSASTTQLVVSVPAGASSGLIQVDVGTTLGLSETSFTVTLPPSISSFSPASGTAGTEVTVSGDHFGATAAENSVSFNGASALVLSASPTALVARVPAAATSGTIAVNVEGMVATSAGSFTLIPSASHTYDGAARLSTVSHSGTTVAYRYDKVGNVLDVRAVAPSGLAIESFMPAQGEAGTEVILQGHGFSATAANNDVRFNGTPALVLAAAADLLRVAVPANASSGSISISVAGQSASSADAFLVPAFVAPVITSFTPATGRGGTPVTVTGDHFRSSSGATSVSVGGTAATPTFVSDTTLKFVVPVFAQTGPITVETSAGSTDSASDFTVDAAADVVVPLTPDQPVTASTVSSGQQVRLTFSATAGDSYALWVQHFSLRGQFILVLRNPDGSINAAISPACHSSFEASGQCGAYLDNLPQSGTYTLTVGTDLMSPFSFLAVLGSRGTAIALTPEVPQLVSTTIVGKPLMLQFHGNADDMRVLSLSQLKTTPRIRGLEVVDIVVYKPDGSRYVDGSGGQQFATTAPFDYYLQHLPQTGTYTVALLPRGAYSLSVNALLSDNLAVPLTLGAAAPVSTTSRAAAMTFAVTAGDHRSVAITAMVVSPDRPDRFVPLQLVAPDGQLDSSFAGQCGSANMPEGGCSWRLRNLAQSGTYTLFMPPTAGSTVSFNATLSTPVDTPIALDTPTAAAVTRPGQAVRYQFTAAAGDNISLGINAFTLAPVNNGYSSLAARVFNPDGTEAVNTWCYASALPNGCSWHLTALPQSGTYTLELGSDSALTFTVTATYTHMGSAVLVADAPGSVLQSAAPGKAYLLQFDATAGQKLSFGLNGGSGTRDALVELYNPDGERNYTISGPCWLSGGGSCGYYLGALPQAGTYRLKVMPEGATQLHATAFLSSPVTGAITTTPLAVSVARPGQVALLSFPVTAGAPTLLEVADVVSTLDGGAGITLLDAAGQSLGGYGGYLQLNLYLPPPASSATYALRLEPSPGVSYAAKVVLDAGTTLPLNGAAVPVVSSLRGQAVRFNVTATAGQALTVHLQSLTASPANVGTYSVATIYAPDGSSLGSTSCDGVGSSCNLSFTATQAGAYTFVLNPTYPFTLTGSATLTSP